MKTRWLIFFLLLSGFFSAPVAGQPVKGIIYADTSAIQIVKLWGTHAERGYALGYLTGEGIQDMITNYIRPMFGSYYNMARNLVIQGNDLLIDPSYQDEAQGIIDGMDASGTNTGNLDATDILVSNTFLDIENLLGKEGGPGCSSLMSWGDATIGTDLEGKSVVSRHLDFPISPVLIDHHTIIIHFPAETDEHPWLHVGFSGMIGTLSGINEDFCAFQHQLADYSGAGLHDKQYTPVWFAMREAIEAADYNHDGHRDVQDVRSALSASQNGFADGNLVCSMARSNEVDSLVAMVAELTPASPTHTYRYNDYPDSIPGDNLYAANEMIKRNDVMHLSARYNAIRNQLSDGTGISRELNWELMRDYSHQSINLQFMQYAPEIDFLQVAVYRNGHPAYDNDPVVFDLQELFDDPSVGIQGEAFRKVTLFPSPAMATIHVSGLVPGRYCAKISDMTGRVVLSDPEFLPEKGMILTSLSKGLYIFQVQNGDGVYTGRFLKK